MTIGEGELVSLVRGLVSPNPEEREKCSGRATDWISAFDDAEARLVSAVLINLAVLEPPGRVRESQLHAVYELAGAGRIDGSWVVNLRKIPSLDPSEREYVEYLLAEYGQV